MTLVQQYIYIYIPVDKVMETPFSDATHGGIHVLLKIDNYLAFVPRVCAVDLFERYWLWRTLFIRNRKQLVR